MHCAFPTGHAPRSLKHRRLGSPFSPQNRNRCQDGSHGSPENRWPTCNVRVGHFFCPSVMRNSFVFFIALGQKKIERAPGSSNASRCGQHLADTMDPLTANAPRSCLTCSCTMEPVGGQTTVFW
jgi:hypothetical protein